MVNLTIVAQRPDRDLLPDENGTPDGGEANVPVEELMTKLRGRKDREGHLVRRASTLQDIRNILETLQRPLDTMQVVGHGLVGAVQLGAFWFHQSGTQPTDPAKVYTLDGNLNRTGLLRATNFQPPAHIHLLGCTAGKPGAPPKTVVDGPTFVFTLSQMWRTEVTAPRETFDADDFDSEGVFAHPEMLVKVARLSVTVPPRPAPASDPSADGSAEVLFKRFVSAPKFAGVVDDTTKLRIGPIERVSGARFSAISFKESFSAPELIFEGSWRDEPWQCEVIADGSLLRMRSGSTTVHLVPNDAAAAQIDSFTVRLCQAAYGS